MLDTGLGDMVAYHSIYDYPFLIDVICCCFAEIVMGEERDVSVGHHISIGFVVC